MAGRECVLAPARERDTVHMPEYRLSVGAHWASDVIAGFALGAIMERLLRLWTGYLLRPSKEYDRANP